MDLLKDVRTACRGLRKAPAFSVMTVLTLAVAIGATTAIFSVVEGVLFQPLPYPDPARVVRVVTRTLPQANLTGGEIPFSDRGYWHFLKNSRSFMQFGGFRVDASGDQSEQWPLTTPGASLMVNVARMTLSAFEVLGVKPQRGRFPTMQEDSPDGLPGGARFVLLSDGLWRGVFGSDPAIIGRQIELDGFPREVIGVMPSHYDFPSPRTDVWLPYQLDPASTNFGGHAIGGIARLAPGATMESATAEAESLVARFKEVGYTEGWFKDIFSGKASVRTLKDTIVRNSRGPLLLVLGTMTFVLLIACSNIANLFLVRAETRSCEAALRMALGSGPTRLIQFVLIEGVVLGLVAGAAGTVLADVGVRGLIAVGPVGIPRVNEIGINGTVLLFSAAISILAGLLCSLPPAIRTLGCYGMMRGLCDGGRSGPMARHRYPARNVLVVTQVALALALVVGSALMMRSFAELNSVNMGFDPAGIVTFRLTPSLGKYDEPESVTRFYDRIFEKLRALPGVSAAGAITYVPLSGLGTDLVGTTRIADFPLAPGVVPPTYLFRRAAPGYFEAMNIAVVEGRTFTEEDHQRRLGTLIISKSLKDRYWPHASALGKKITIAGDTGIVVGVVSDVHNTGLDIPAEAAIYKPMLDKSGGRVRTMAVTVRSARDPLSLVPEIRAAVTFVDSALPITDIQSMPSIVADSLSRTSFTMTLLAIAAALALFLAAIGIYGVMAYEVSQRRAEIGLRLALGAAPLSVRGLILKRGMRICAVGIVLGLAAAIALGRLLSGLLYGVSSYDVLSLLVSAVAFSGVAVLASALPAARAARIPPAAAFRV